MFFFLALKPLGEKSRLVSPGSPCASLKKMNGVGVGGGRAFPSDQGCTATFVRVDGGEMTEPLSRSHARQTETQIGFIHDFLLVKIKTQHSITHQGFTLRL